MGQSININGIKGFLQTLITPKLFVPSRIVRDIRGIDFAELHKLGFKAIVYDKDNTLTAPYSNQIHARFGEAFEESKRVFGSNVLIVSNSVGTLDDPDYRGATEVEKLLGVSVLRHSDKKPEGSEILSNYFQCRDTEIIVVGDRVCTDIVYGNRIKAHTILVDEIITAKGDNRFAVIVPRR